MREYLDALAKYEHLLPPEGREISRVIGVTAMIALVKAVGGTTMIIPKAYGVKPPASYTLLVDFIGETAADKLCRHYGGFKVYIPKCEDALRRLRNVMMTEEYDSRIRAGETGTDIVKDLVRRYNLSDRRVEDIVNQPVSEWAQPEKAKKLMEQHTLFCL
ncbi:hypothetical protein LJC46_02210 [Desulfovibrio sp. OttesenSCG-928-G15]|nr:hypothetical protein [Desulfovibrio sp. OttesenSCG-928-G15]